MGCDPRCEEDFQCYDQWPVFLRLYCLEASAVATAPDAEANYKKRIDLANELSDALEKKDEAKAKSVATELNALEDKLTKTKVTESQKKRIEEKYKADNDKAVERFRAAVDSNRELAIKSGYKFTD